MNWARHRRNHSKFLGYARCLGKKQHAYYDIFFKWYNNLDVILMIENVQKLAQQYKAKGIDCFKQAISSPVTALITGMKASEMAGYKFPLVNEKNKDFHYKINQNRVVGPSIVFSQLNISGETSIRDTSNICQNILGYDANSLYPYCIQQFLPVNCFIGGEMRVDSKENE